MACCAFSAPKNLLFPLADFHGIIAPDRETVSKGDNNAEARISV